MLFRSAEGEADCENAQACVAKYVWQRINDSINDAVDGISLAELVAKIPKETPQAGVARACQQS